MPSRIVAVILLLTNIIFFCVVGYSFFGDRNVVALFALAGACLGLLSFYILKVILNLETLRIIGACTGSLGGMVFGAVLVFVASQTMGRPEITNPMLGYISLILTIYGLIFGWTKIGGLKWVWGEKDTKQNLTGSILDTSVIIDGRIADICETGFIIRDLIIPQFVLKELQMIADSGEMTKRTRGRRGLDILNKIQKQTSVNIRIDSTDYPAVREVDQKLILLAKEKGFSILTNDFNLNKVAEVHAVQVLNINQLANALKPIVLPGETMKVQIIKEGKEPTQGVAYLDDGTMVVVEQGKKYMGKTIDAMVTSVLQTTAGRMIFAASKTS